MTKPPLSRTASATAAANADAAPLWTLVRSRIDASADDTAIVSSGAVLSYGELGELVDRHAATLKERCAAAPETVVAIALPRSIDLVVWELATLSCGAAFMPFDPAEPLERRNMMVRDAGAVALIDSGGVHALGDGRPLAPLSDDPAGRAAYVLFTSGSTGVPKGVVTEHRSVAGYIEFIVDHYGLSPADAQVQFCSPAFDISVEETFSTLAAGATLVIRDDDVELAAGPFLGWLEEQRATVLNLPTGAFRQLAAELRRNRSIEVPDGVRLVVIGGEAASPDDITVWKGAARGPLRIVNAYGPTETTISVCMAELEADAPVTIGRPVAGALVYPADADLRPVADGESGELCVEGRPLARGYIGDDALTEARFPRLDDGRRVYRTGDRGRVLPGGMIEFLGRTDDQVKVRGGFRVEPGEIRAVLLAQPDVYDAFVDAFDAGGARKLVAYVVADADERSLRSHVAAHLPSFMVPSVVMQLDRLPLTARGKVDRRALRDLLDERRELELAAPGPSELDELRAVVAAEWRAVLGEQPEEDDDSFFEVGGDSLGTVELLAALHERTGVQVELRRFLTDPTPGRLLTELVVDPEAAPDVHHTTGRTVVRMRRRGAGTLWCFMPPLSGAVTRYGSMARLLPLSDAVWACESPAELSAAGMSGLADGLADALVEEGLGAFSTICLSGYSLGGVIGLEVARRLIARGDVDATVDVLMLDPPRPGIALATLEETLAIFVNVGWRIDTDAGRFLRRDGSVALDEIAVAARAAGMLPAAAPDSEIADSWTVYSHNATLLEGYRPEPLPGGAAAMLRCAGRTDSLPSSWSTSEVPPAWAAVVDPDRCASIEIDHFGLMEPPTDAVVATWLGRSRRGVRQPEAALP